MAAVRIQSRLKPRGVIAFHVSNRFFDLAPVLAGVAGEQGLVWYGRDRDVPPEKFWTDDYSDLLGGQLATRP